jgi:hypothetical protein
MLRMKAAATACWPVRTKIGGVRIGTVPPSPGSSASCATPRPSIEMSTSVSGAPAPNCVTISKTYAPSAGKSCVTTVPPLVPKGVPSM